MTMIKLCGITSAREADILNEALPDFAGFVLFFPKSRRNISLDNACSIKKLLDKRIHTVAVTVAPDMNQIKAIAAAGFDYIQIHGNIPYEYYDLIDIPVLKAFNISDMSEYDNLCSIRQIHGFVFDAPAPGSGSTFDWSVLADITRSDKLMFLAGGLNPENVAAAIRCTHPDVVDVSSGIELETGYGKDSDKIRRFVKNVRDIDCNN